MSKVRIYGDTSGYIDLKAPDTASNATITLPNTTGPFATETYVDSAVAAIPGIGSNVVTSIKTDTQTASVASGATETVSGLSAAITPTSATSKILVLLSLSMAWQGAAEGAIDILRDGVAVQVGDAAGSRSRMTAGGSGGNGSRIVETVAVTLLDSPATTSAVTYTVLTRNAETATRLVYINRPELDDDAAYNARTSSSLTVIEVAA